MSCCSPQTLLRWIGASVAFFSFLFLFIAFHGQSALLLFYSQLKGLLFFPLGGGSSDIGGSVNVIFWAPLYLPFFGGWLLCTTFQVFKCGRQRWVWDGYKSMVLTMDRRGCDGMGHGFHTKC